MHVVVTGGAGFIGSHLVDRLMSNGHSVVVLDSLVGGYKPFLAQHFSSSRFSFRRLDIRRTKQLIESLQPNTSRIYHLAANSDISRGVDDPSLDFHHGLEATYSLLQAMRARGLRDLVYTSGSGVYGDCGETYCRENSGPLQPVSMYGASKLGAEGLISAFAYLFDMKAWILRPANIVGPRATHGVIYDFFRKLTTDSRQLRILGDGRQSKAYLHVSDVLDAIDLAVRNTSHRINVFNVSSRSYITVNEIADLVVKGMGLQHESVRYRHSGGPTGWRGDVAVVRLSSSAIRELGWRPRFSSRAAVQATIASLVSDSRFRGG